MKNKIIKIISLVLLGVMMWGNSVAFAVLEQVTVVDAVASHTCTHPNCVNQVTTNVLMVY